MNATSVILLMFVVIVFVEISYFLIVIGEIAPIVDKKYDSSIRAMTLYQILSQEILIPLVFNSSYFMTKRRMLMNIVFIVSFNEGKYL
jgi:hypothetical protein